MPAPSPAACSVDAPGWFGKVAALGDFAQRRLPAAFVRACDAWLAHGMRSGAELLGAAWPGCYRVAPLLRFAWAPGVIGSADGAWWFGVLMPSCDRSGRYFPLLVARPRPRPPHDRIALEHLRRWHAHVAAAALQTLDGASGSVDAFEAALLEAPAWPAARDGAAAEPGADARTPRASASRVHTSLAHTPFACAAPPCARPALPHPLAGCSVWWPLADVASAKATACDEGFTLDVFEGVAPSHGAEVVAGLPRGAAFVRVLTAAGIEGRASAGAPSAERGVPTAGSRRP